MDIENLSDAPYFSSNQTYNVSNHTKGPFFDILKHLEKKFNFTTQLYKRKVVGWGSPVITPNGSIQISDGVIKDVMTESADMIVASLNILYR